MVDPGAARQAVREGAHSRCSGRSTCRHTWRDRRRRQAPDSWHGRTRGHRRRRGLARHPERARQLEPEPGGRPGAPPSRTGDGQAPTASSRPHPETVLQAARRTRPSSSRPERRADDVPAGAGRAVPRLQGGGPRRHGATAGRLRQRVPRPARPDQQGGAESGAYTDAKPGEIVGQSGVEAAYDHLLNRGFVQAKIPVDSFGRDRRRPPRAARRSSRRRCSSRSTCASRGPRRTRSSTGWSSRASAATHRPGRPRWPSIPGRARSRRSQLPDFRPEARGREAELPRTALQGDGATPLLNRAIGGAYPTGSTFKPIIAEAALSGGIITPGTPLSCTGAFAPRRHDLPQRRSGVNATMTLRRRSRSRATRGSTGSATSIYRHDPQAQGTLIQNWARKLGSATRRPDDLTGATPATSPGRAGSRESGYGFLERKGRRSTSRSARARCR